MKYLLFFFLSVPAFGAKGDFSVQDMKKLAKVVVPILSRCGDLYTADEIKLTKLKNKTSESLNRAALLGVMKETLGDMVRYSDTAKLELRTIVSSEISEGKKAKTITYKLQTELWGDGKMRCESSGEMAKVRRK